MSLANNWLNTGLFSTESLVVLTRASTMATMSAPSAKSYNLQYCIKLYRVQQKKWTPKVFRRFLSNHLGF